MTKKILKGVITSAKNNKTVSWSTNLNIRFMKKL